MERLTVFDGEFWVHKDFPPIGADTVDDFVDCVKDLAARLAAIEDILGDDYDIDHLRDLMEAEREGRCTVLPVKVGGTVYRVITTRDCPPLLSEIVIKTVEQAASLIGRMGKHLVISYYPTREAAEAALKGEHDVVH